MGLLKWYGFRALKKIKILFGIKSDDFAWDNYTSIYSQELEVLSQQYTLALQSGDYGFSNEKLVKTNTTIKPLISNHHLLYETVLQLKPKKVLEVGCGGGDHLHNLKSLHPGIDIMGIDLSVEQLAYLKERYPNLNIKTQQCDITQLVSYDFPKVELVYTQAVIMHIQVKGKHLVALENLFKIASKQVVLMENWRQHAFLDDILMLYKQNKIAWPNLYVYYRKSDNDQTKLLIVSSVVLSGYTELNDYNVMLEV